jgi:hypothetical protein
MLAGLDLASVFLLVESSAAGEGVLVAARLAWLVDA